MTNTTFVPSNMTSSDGGGSMDADSDAWLSELRDVGSRRDAALSRLHAMLLKVCMKEAYRRASLVRLGGPELDDVAHQAADDALLAVLSKLETFRGESRFTTWVYRFGVIEVANKVSRHPSNKPQVSLDAEEWDRLPANFGDDPLAMTQHADLIAAVRRAVDESLTDRQRRFFVASVVNGISTDVLAAETATSLGAIYKIIFDARRKIRDHLTAHGYLDAVPPGAREGRRTAKMEKA
ncbi:RNA polymerase sigma factor [Microbacterium sp. NPDC058345]|uniref:RNA polymerase sigma factor n=1 Tax=Microbacterium sp. NPDC058345 TaxID=3346455 RepID=UPI0036539D5A